MESGEISGNTSSSGGGVYVAGGTFTMNGGEISGNTGGGVYVGSGTFRIVTGTIYGSNEADTSLRNIANTGAALYRYGTTEFGTFSGSTWNSNGTLGTTNDTIRVVNGEYYAVGNITNSVWRDGNAISLTVPTVSFGNITTQGWQISDTGSGGWVNFTPPSTANMSYNGKYLRYYATSGGQTFYSNTASIRVLSATEQEVSIAMWDSDSDGWNDSAALRINVNGTNLTTNAKLSSGGGPGYYTFSINTGDVVQIYWVSGSYDSECAFAVYYSDNPPSPAFSPNSSSWSSADDPNGKVLLYRQYNTMGSVSNGTLMGSFTVQ
jgi:hypothetical protein